jgi:glycine cleavage system H protein
MKQNEIRKKADIGRRKFLQDAVLATGGAALSLAFSSAACSSGGGMISETTSPSGEADRVSAIDSAEILYTIDGIWINDEGDNNVRLGITEHLYRLMTHQGAQGMNSLELPEPGGEITRGNAFGMLESSKMAVDLISPVSGTVIGVSDRILSTNDIYNGWMLLVRLSKPEELQALLSYDEYLATYSSSGE